MEAKEWICCRCGHQVVTSKDKPEPISWSNGHECRFIALAPIRDAAPELYASTIELLAEYINLKQLLDEPVDSGITGRATAALAKAKGGDHV